MAGVSHERIEDAGEFDAPADGIGETGGG